jgi:hypothetical protein
VVWFIVPDEWLIGNLLVSADGCTVIERECVIERGGERGIYAPGSKSEKNDLHLS